MGFLLGWPSLAHTLLSGLMAFATTTPDIASIAAVAALWRVTLGLSGGVAALALLAAAGAAGLPTGLGPRLPLAAVALRAGACVLLATQSLALVGWSIGASNALVADVAHSPLLTAALAAPQPPAGILAALIAVVPYMALLVVLAVVYAVRLVELVILAVLAPLVLAAAIHPAAESLARAWLGEFAAVLLLQPVQAVMLVVFQVAVIALPAATSPIEALVSSLALLYLTVRLPGWLRRFAHTAGLGAVVDAASRAAGALLAASVGGP